MCTKITDQEQCHCTMIKMLNEDGVVITIWRRCQLCGISFGCPTVDCTSSAADVMIDRFTSDVHLASKSTAYEGNIFQYGHFVASQGLPHVHSVEVGR